MYCIAYIIIHNFIYLLRFLLNLLCSFSFVRNTSSLCEIKITAYIDDERLQTRDYIFSEKGLELFPGNGL